MRKDGNRVKKADLLYTVVPYVMSKRVDSMNMITVDVPVEPLNHYINEQRKQGRGISTISLVLCAWLQTVQEYPLLNRFVVNRRLFDRNELCVSMVVLRPGEDESTMSKMYFDRNDTIFTVQQKVSDYFAVNRQASSSNNSTDKLADFLGNVPGLLAVGVPLIKWADRHGLLPKAIIDASPFHASLAITNLASIRTNHIYHHVYEFGTISVFMAMGNLREVPVRERDQVVFKRCIPIGVVMDERICSGHYFAQALTRMQKYWRDPSLMELSYDQQQEAAAKKAAKAAAAKAAAAE
ncbi:MAG: 2-oxo acid dehydrogenase subunit E2 [Firmicutes bacterium]|nr:2-oxo acid dehydrogenase subunit E2 [Bacillota bacterium]